MSQADVLARLAQEIAAVEARPADVAPAAPAALPEDGAAALAQLVRSTSQRPLTVAEARDLLLAKDHPEPLVRAVIAQATATRILDDRAFAQAWVEDRGIKRGYGRDRLQRELQRRQVDQADIDLALDALEEHDEVAQATDLARKRAQGMPATLEPHKVAQRLVGFLLRRGFPSHVAHDVARRVTAMDREWD